jgi:hypothetical protein
MVLAMFKIEIENSKARSAQQILNSNFKNKKKNSKPSTRS